MKIAEWHELCRREQEQGREVIGVTLVPRSAQELANEVLRDASAVTHLSEGVSPRVAAGARVGKIVNWAADTVLEVGVDQDAEADTITVRDADGQTRVVALATAR